ncbi:MAG: hypothetical protein GY829_15085 [Gammaproteobacteria bacterium]|nr:hypothetical protein [Gammaproteobacteria bacterium]
MDNNNSKSVAKFFTFILPSLLFVTLISFTSGVTASQKNYCDCDVSKGKCSCTESFKMSAGATHTYRTKCYPYSRIMKKGARISTDAKIPVSVYEYEDKYYWFTSEVKGANKDTTCINWNYCDMGQTKDCRVRQCTNWSFGSDSTSTVVNCYMSETEPEGAY